VRYIGKGLCCEVKRGAVNNQIIRINVNLKKKGFCIKISYLKSNTVKSAVGFGDSPVVEFWGILSGFTQKYQHALSHLEEAILMNSQYCVLCV